jgi:hypothetical protein
MRGKALGLVTVDDGSGPEFDISELTTWLNDAVCPAPAMLLHPRTAWEAVGDDRFRVSVTDAGHPVSAEVFLDDDSRPRDFRTTDRWADLPGGPVRAPWTTPVAGWTVVDGWPHPTGGAAVWHLPDGEFRYGEMTLQTLDLDVPAAGAGGRVPGTSRRSVRCLLGRHAWVRRHPPGERYEGPDHMVCRRCGKETGPLDIPPGFFYGAGPGGGMS